MQESDLIVIGELVSTQLGLRLTSVDSADIEAQSGLVHRNDPVSESRSAAVSAHTSVERSRHSSSEQSFGGPHAVNGGADDAAQKAPGNPNLFCQSAGQMLAVEIQRHPQFVDSV